MIHRRRAKPLLGTLVEIGVMAETQEHADTAFAAAFGEIAAIHVLMSFHEPASDLGRINVSPVSSTTSVDLRTAAVLHAAQAAAEESGYAFDCTVASELVAAGLLPAHAGQEPSLLRDGMLRWHIEGTTFHKHAPCLLDLGGIAKGYAVDRALAMLLQHGCTEALVNAGGDLRYHGSEAMVVHLRSPDKPDSMPLAVSLYNEALASSAAGGLDADGMGERSALFDGATRRALPAGSAASIIAPTCMEADLLTKVVLASGDPRHPMLSRRGAQVAFFGTAS
ncbi:MAG TPA: FAD:protein FMN transferase [Burkholderiaceae bacterium]